VTIGVRVAGRANKAWHDVRTLSEREGVVFRGWLWLWLRDRLARAVFKLAEDDIVAVGFFSGVDTSCAQVRVQVDIGLPVEVGDLDERVVWRTTFINAIIEVV